MHGDIKPGCLNQSSPFKKFNTDIKKQKIHGSSEMNFVCELRLVTVSYENSIYSIVTISKKHLESTYKNGQYSSF